MEEINKLVTLIKSVFPSMKVTKQNLLKPTCEFVCQFYNLFLEELTAVTGYSCNDLEPDPDFSAEYILFYKLKKIFQTLLYYKNKERSFWLDDIYQPKPKKTKLFIQLCIDLLTNLKQKNNQIKDIVESELKMVELKRELGEKDNVNFEDLNQKISDAQVKLEDSEQHLKHTSTKLDEMREYANKEEKVIADKEAEVKELTSQLENFEVLNGVIQRKQIEYNKQIVSESDYRHLVKAVEEFKEEKAESSSKINALEEEIKIKSQELNNVESMLSLNEKLRKFDPSLPELISQLEKQHESKSENKNKDEINQIIHTLKSARESLLEKLNAAQKDYKNDNEFIKALFVKNENDIRNYTVQLGKLTNDENSSKQRVENLKSDLKKMRTKFEVNYIKILKKERDVMDQFKEMLKNDSSDSDVQNSESEVRNTILF